MDHESLEDGLDVVCNLAGPFAAAEAMVVSCTMKLF